MYGDKTVCVWDNGLFTSLAVTLAKSFGTTLYYSPWQRAYPRMRELIIGDGLPGVTRIKSPWPLLDKIDLFVFPDIFSGPEQEFLRKNGKRVWGSGLADTLEWSRSGFKKWLRAIDLPVGRHGVITGTDALRSYLKRNDDQHVKFDLGRGDMETFHAETYELVEPRLAELEHALGAYKEAARFVSEDGIPARAEVGFDGFTIDGTYPGKALFGVESKDAAYVGKVVPYAALPQSVAYVNQQLAEIFDELTYRGFFSSEIRIGEDGTAYLIDPCCRMASPPGELYQHLITNLADVIWNGAEGVLVEPEWKHPFGAELILRSAWAEDGWQPLDIPEEIRDHVLLHYHARIGSRDYYVPQSTKMPEIGAVVAGGDTLEAAMRAVGAIAEQVKGLDVRFDVAALDTAAENLENI